MPPDSAVPGFMISALQSTRPLVDPVDALTPAIEGRRWVWPLLLLMLTASLSAAAFATRWNARPSTLSELENQGELAKTTEQALDEKVVTAGRVKLITGVLKGVFVKPFAVLALAAFLKFVAWLFGKKARFAALFSATALASLPVSLYHLIYALCALRHSSLPDDAEKNLVPSSLAQLVHGVGPTALRALAAVDFFHLWSLGLLGLGFATVSQMQRSRALALMLVLYAMYVGVFMIGLPAMGGGNGGGGHP